MPKIVTLMRHGKSSWNYDVQDEYRPLKKRAYNDISYVFSSFKTYMNDSIVFITSPAVRAETTAKHFLKLAGLSELKLSTDPNLYTFNPNSLEQIIKSLDDEISEIMIFGHNPAFTAIANHFGDQYFDNVPTSGLVQIKFEQDAWKAINNGKTLLYLFPKNLR